MSHINGETSAATITLELHYYWWRQCFNLISHTIIIVAVRLR